MRFSRIYFSFLALAVSLFFAAGLAAAATITVTSIEDSGAGTLREALTLVSDNDTIDFALGGNSITVYTALPVANKVTIDGGGTQVVGANGAAITIFNIVSVAGDGTILNDLALIDSNVAVYLNQTDNVGIYNCRIGTDWSGNTTVGNLSGILLNGATNIAIGSAGNGNVISGNTDNGMQIYGGADTIIIQANFIGTDSAGAAALGLQNNGIFINDASNITIGGDRSAGEGNVISGHTNSGIDVNLVSGPLGTVTVAGNIIGLNATQDGVLSNGTGVRLNGSAGYCAVGVNEADKHNIICGNTMGIRIYSANHVIQNNLIGVNEADVSYPNVTNGIYLNGANSNLIGGRRHSAFFERNVISGHIGSGDEGIDIAGGSSGNTIAGNYIGTDSTGTNTRSNFRGIFVTSGSGNLFGGATSDSITARGNIISGNAQTGIVIAAGSGNYLLGNTVGLTINEDAALPNNEGIWFSGATCINSFVGSSATAYANVVAGNNLRGIRINASASGHVVRGNYLGFARDGLSQFSQAAAAIELNLAYGCWVGGPAYADGNLIDGGILIDNSASGNTVAANRIGVREDLSTPSTTYNAGIFIYNNAIGNFIGLPNGGMGNLIANQLRNLDVEGSGTDYNGFYGNTITAASALPIELDPGVNQDKAAPLITAAYASQVAGTAEANNYIEVFKAESGAGNGGSLSFLGYTTADGSGNWSITPAGLLAGEFVCAMATDSANNTSNFSGNVTVLPPPTATPTSTATLTVTATATATITETATPTPTVTPTTTNTPVFSATVTSTITPTATISATVTITPSTSPTASATSTTTPQVAVDLAGKFALAYPNPAQDSMTFIMNLRNAAEIELKIYNLAGERISEIQENLSAGSQIIVWDCSDVAPGVYLVRIFKDGSLQETQRVAILK